MAVRLGSVVINCADLATMTSFWSQALSLAPSSTDTTDDFRVLRGARFNVSLQLADTTVTARGQTHLDLYTEDQEEEVSRLEGLGATVQHRPDDPAADFVVMRDPEGNPFCVCDVPAAEPAYIAVVGPGEESLAGLDHHDDVLSTAREIGTLLARRRCVVLCGGGSGVMAAVADGVAAVGGTSLGILPGSSRREAHAGLTYALPTGLGELRNGLLVRAADAVIAVGGSWGTLSEIALAVRTSVPVASVHGWDLPAGVTTCSSAQEAVDAVVGRAGGDARVAVL
jgi:uncharacterized protein (TIGR00725 family)